MRFDVAVERALERLAHLDRLTVRERRQVRLPFALGGASLPAATSTAPAACFGSWLHCLADVAAATDLTPRQLLSSANGQLQNNLQATAEEWERASARVFWEEIDSGGTVRSWHEAAERGVMPRRQRALSRPLAQASRRELLATAPDADDAARIRSCGGAGAGAWLACPDNARTQMADTHFVPAYRMRWGQPVAPGDPQSPCH